MPTISWTTTLGLRLALHYPQPFWHYRWKHSGCWTGIIMLHAVFCFLQKLKIQIHLGCICVQILKHCLTVPESIIKENFQWLYIMALPLRWRNLLVWFNVIHALNTYKSVMLIPIFIGTTTLPSFLTCRQTIKWPVPFHRREIT